MSHAAPPSFEVFFDGDCPLCRREIAFLARRDRHQRLSFTNIADPAFDAAAHGLTRAEFMAQIRGRVPGGELIAGVEVFRQLYSAVGFGWLVRVTRMPGIAWLLDRGYAWFARNRLRLTRRCADDACRVPARAEAA
jgi:predicted DCC family thiol-disulfide oxidoreductase YuxK